MGEPKSHSRIFYGWYIVAGSFTMLFFNSGALYAFGVMFKPIIEEFGWSRGSISLGSWILDIGAVQKSSGALSIMYRVSSIRYRVPASVIEYPTSSIRHPASAQD